MNTITDSQPSDFIEANKAAGGDCVSRLVLPLMMLDESMPETHMAPIHPETGEVWGEKQWELVELATAWRYESDDDLRKEAEAEYIAAKEGVTFAERPLFKQSSFILGAAYKDLPPPREMYHCHPKTWEKVPDDAKAQFEVRVASEYSFLGQNSISSPLRSRYHSPYSVQWTTMMRSISARQVKGFDGFALPFDLSYFDLAV